MVHGETHGFVMDREAEFVPLYEKLATRFPRLRIIMEHITTRQAAECLDRHENLFATVTLQHLLITLDDVAGGLLRPHLFCKPIAKRAEDRDALLEKALGGHPKLMFGSDSAPHPRESKEACGCAAGVFTAPLALPRLAQLFAEHGVLDRLPDFVGGHARRNYGVESVGKDVLLERGEFPVPTHYGTGEATVVPMHAGESLAWRVAGVQCPEV
jgi:dihydroorotase